MSTSTPPIDWPHYGIGFIPAVKRVFQKYATFDGRASRSEFWWWALGNFIVFLVLYGLTMGLGFATAPSDGEFGVAGIPFAILLGVWLIGTIVPNIAITIRRLHDAGYSGWFYLLSLIPYLGSFIVAILCIMGTSPMAGRYGPPHPDYGYQPQLGYGQQPYTGQVYGQGPVAAQPPAGDQNYPGGQGYSAQQGFAGDQNYSADQGYGPSAPDQGYGQPDQGNPTYGQPYGDQQGNGPDNEQYR